MIGEYLVVRADNKIHIVLEKPNQVLERLEKSTGNKEGKCEVYINDKLSRELTFYYNYNIVDIMYSPFSNIDN